MMQKSMLDARRFIRRMCWLAANPLVLSVITPNSPLVRAPKRMFVPHNHSKARTPPHFHAPAA